MGKLSAGTILDWSETKQLTSMIHDIGAEQLLELWRRECLRTDNDILWGDEVGQVSGLVINTHASQSLSITSSDTMIRNVKPTSL